VCARHGRWLLNVGDGHDLEYLDVSGCEELAAAQARWLRVAGWPGGRRAPMRNRVLSSRWRGRWCAGGGSEEAFRQRDRCGAAS
jgi:hypothetical protein